MRTHEDRVLLATLLQKQMDTKGWSIRKVSRLCGLGRGTINALLSGTHSPSLDTVYKLMRGMELPSLLSELELLV